MRKRKREKRQREGEEVEIIEFAIVLKVNRVDCGVKSRACIVNKAKQKLFL